MQFKGKLEYRKLGKSGLLVSRLCFGTLTLSPMQKNLSLEAGSTLIRQALEAGVNFFDTAQLYQTYPYLKNALKDWPHEAFIATKSYAWNRVEMNRALEEARCGLDRDVIDIFLLHEQENEYTIAGHREALETLLEAKEKGLVLAVGISTHTVAAVRAASEMTEIDVIHPLINMAGIGIQGGTLDDMLSAIGQAADNGKGIYAMKVLGGGHLYNRNYEALLWAKEQPLFDSVAVGMAAARELSANMDLFSGEKVQSLFQELSKNSRVLHIEDWCEACGRCVPQCPQQALALREQVIQVDKEKCVFCGYCAAHCPHFCLKVL